MQRIVNWVQSAWTHIQEKRDWNWLWTSSTVAISPWFRLFSPVADWTWNVHDWDYETMRLYQTALGVGDEQYLYFMPWDDFKLSYNIGTIYTQRPTIVTRRPDEKLMFNFMPDVPYTFSAEYYSLPSSLANDTDTPAMPTRFHEIIVWKASMYYAEQEEAGVLLSEMTRRYRDMLTKLEESQLQKYSMARPLA